MTKKKVGLVNPNSRLPRADKLVGHKFNRLLITDYLGSNQSRHSVYLCECDCGAEVEVRRPDLISKSVQSCGCLKRELMQHSPNNWRECREKLARRGSAWIRVDSAAS